MIDKKNDITNKHIVLMYNKTWYCFPFNILEDQVPFMDLIYKSLGFSSSKFPVEADTEIRISFSKIANRQPWTVIFDFFNYQEDPYGEMIRFIDSRWDQFNPVLNACQLY